MAYSLSVLNPEVTKLLLCSTRLQPEKVFGDHGSLVFRKQLLCELIKGKPVTNNLKLT